MSKLKYQRSFHLSFGLWALDFICHLDFGIRTFVADPNPCPLLLRLFPVKEDILPGGREGDTHHDVAITYPHLPGRHPHTVHDPVIYVEHGQGLYGGAYGNTQVLQSPGTLRAFEFLPLPGHPLFTGIKPTCPTIQSTMGRILHPYKENRRGVLYVISIPVKVTPPRPLSILYYGLGQTAQFLPFKYLYLYEIFPLGLRGSPCR